MDENDIGTLVMTAAVDIHRNLCPGLLESVHEVVLAHTLRQQGLRAQRQVPIAITYNGLKFDEGFRADIIVEGRVILELKCVEKLANGHKKQLLTYLKLSGLKLGYLFNFSAAVMRDGGCSRCESSLTRILIRIALRKYLAETRRTQRTRES